MRSKQIIISVVVVLIIASFVVIPMLKNDDDYVETLAAEFTFSENLATNFGNKISISFEVKSDDVVKTDLFLNDSLLCTWKSPKGIIKFPFDASFYGLGAKTISLISTLKNGDEKNDSRLIRILADTYPESLNASISKLLVHNTSNFTQGLEFSEGVLYESTGLNGRSKIAQIQLETGKSIKEIGLDENYFGEGITILNNKIYQLTWQNQKCFVYDKNTLQLEKDLPYSGEGWGLCNDGKSIIMSNGTETLTFRNPETFQIEKTIEVYDNIGPRIRLNELEFINGKIYANIWMLDLILEIDPNSGKVISEIDCSEVVKSGKGSGEVLNGIAFNTKTNKIYLTGKNWSKILEVEFK